MWEKYMWDQSAGGLLCWPWWMLKLLAGCILSLLLGSFLPPVFALVKLCMNGSDSFFWESHSFVSDWLENLLWLYFLFVFVPEVNVWNWMNFNPSLLDEQWLSRWTLLFEFLRGVLTVYNMTFYSWTEKT